MNNICQKVISGIYLIPPVLAGADQQNGFSSPNLKDAYDIFNSQTVDERELIEGLLNRVLAASIFGIQIKLTNKKFNASEENEGEENKQDGNGEDLKSTNINKQMK